jgi:NADH:ubiquinone oxidoreductase subunit 5 (subunit L)/multisubunit Na+/H+ antiporter MnhA subunit/multisubunit Na+/H+ antiporter MnhB subunit
VNSPLLLLAVALPFAAAAVAPILARWMHSAAGRVLAIAFLPTLALATLVPAVRAGSPAHASLPWVPRIDLELSLRADGFSLLFALLVGAIGTLIMLYAASYLGREERHGRFFAYLLLFGGAMLGLVLADNLIALFLFWELTSITSFLLIGFWDSRRASQDGAVKALLVTSLGGLGLLASVALLGIAGGTMTISELDPGLLRSSPLFPAAVTLLLLAAFTKSAQLPFHLWLPTAMEAPTPVSAFLHSATMVKAGVILVAKFGFLLQGLAFQQVVLYVGLATMFWGGYLALRQTDLKALLAYSTVSQLGILTALYGAGHEFAATAHLVNHAAFKATLFLVVGIVDHETGSRDVTKLSGLWRKLPITTLLAVPAALSMAGLPPFGGFISKELFYEEMLREGLVPIAITVLGSVITFAYSLKFLSVFFGPYRAERPEVHEAKVAFWAPVAPLALAVLIFGVFPWNETAASFFTTLAAPSFGYDPHPLALWHGPNVMLALSVLTWFFGTALFVARGEFTRFQERITPSWNSNTVYYGLLGAIASGAEYVIGRTQGAPFASHLRLVLLPAAVVGLVLGAGAFLPASLTPPTAAIWLVAALLLAGAVGVLMATSRLTLLITMGLTGFGSTLAFVLLRAPDLALTQLLIEVVTVILFLSVFHYLPRLSRYSRPRWMSGLDALIAIGVGLTVFVLLLAVQNPVGPRLADYFLEHSKTLGGGYNVVNVILVDFRGYDTMGEITVLAVVAVAVYALLRLRATPGTAEDEVDEP